MRPKVLVLLIISIFLPLLHCYGQYVDDENFPDTVRSYNSKVYAIPNLDSLKPKFVDTITNPDGFVIYSRAPDCEPCVALKEKNYFKVFSAGNWGCTKAERIDFDGKGSKELLLTYEWNLGNNHFCEYHKGFYLVNLDSTKVLMDVEYCFSYIQYPEMERDSNGDYYQVDSNDNGAGGDVTNFIPNVKKCAITFTEAPLHSGTCAQDTEEIFLHPTVIKYRLVGNSIIRLNDVSIDSVKQLFKKNSIITYYKPELPGVFYTDTTYDVRDWGKRNDTMTIWIFSKNNKFTEYIKPFGTNRAFPWQKICRGKIKIDTDAYHIYITVTKGSSKKKYVFIKMDFEADSEGSPFRRAIYIKEIK